MGYIIDVIEDLTNIDLNYVYVNGVKVIADPRPSTDGSLFLLRGDQFDDLVDDGNFPLYFSDNTEIITYLNAHASVWDKDY